MTRALVPEAWDKHLAPDDPDRAFIIEGLRSGFHITNLDTAGAGAYHKNHKSATCGENLLEVERQINKELANGRYIKVSQPSCPAWLPFQREKERACV